VTGATIRCLSHSANPAIKTWSWSSESNTRRRGTSSLHCHCARPANSWSWHAASNCGRALTMRLLFPLSYTSENLWRWRGELHSRMICFAGRRLAVLATPPQILERSTGIAPVLPDWRSGVLLLYELRPGERRGALLRADSSRGLHSNALRSPHINGASSES
jgi:hypothetical protein